MRPPEGAHTRTYCIGSSKTTGSMLRECALGSPHAHFCRNSRAQHSDAVPQRAVCSGKMWRGRAEHTDPRKSRANVSLARGDELEGYRRGPRAGERGCKGEAVDHPTPAPTRCIRRKTPHRRGPRGLCAVDAAARRNQRVAQLRAGLGAQTNPYPHADTHCHKQENASTRCPCLSTA